MELEVWAQNCADLPTGPDNSSTDMDAALDPSLPDQGSPPPPVPASPPCSEEPVCNELCDWIQACASDERTCSRPDPERSGILDDFCQEVCTSLYVDAILEVLCEQTDCTDLRDIEAFDQALMGEWSTMWQHCSDDAPDSGARPADAGRPAGDMAR